MANGIKTPGTWVPGTKSGVVVESKFVKGGYITVDSVEERDRLLSSSEVITSGTKIFVQNENIEYIYIETASGQGEFQDTAANTINKITAEGFVKDTQVETIVQREAQTMVEDAVKETVPGMVDKQINIKLEDVKTEITEEATAAAKEEAVKQVEQQIEKDYVKDEKLNSTIEPIQSDISNLKQKSQEADEKIDQNAADITSVTTQVNNLNSNLSENYYNKDDINAKISGVYHYKGSVETIEDFPKDAQVGDVYNVNSTGMNYAWTGEVWDELGTLFEADNYYTKEATDGQITAKLEGYTPTEDLNQELDLKADKTSLETLASKDEVSNQIKEVRDSIAADLAYGEF